MRWACLAIFFLALGLGEVCTRGRWNLPSEGFPGGQSSRRNQCTGTGSFDYLHACACMDRHARTTSPHTPPPPPDREIPLLQSIDKVFDVLGPGVQAVRSQSRSLSCCVVGWTLLLTCPSVCNNRCWVLIVDGRALCTGTGPGFTPAMRPSRFSPRTEFILFFARSSLVFMKAWMSLVVVFAFFPQKCEVGSALDFEGARQCHLTHAGGSARGCARAGLHGWVVCVWGERGRGKGGDGGGGAQLL